MATMPKSSYLQELEDMLASDDEFPSDFNEVSVNIPLEDYSCELETIVFPWLKNRTVRCMRKVNEETGETTFSQTPFVLNESTLNNRTSQLPKGERVVAIKGVLSRNDIVSLKSIIKARPGDGTILWFVNFLMYKDLQSEYSFLQSCLVNDRDEEQYVTASYRDMNNHNFFLSTV